MKVVDLRFVEHLLVFGEHVGRFQRVLVGWEATSGTLLVPIGRPLLGADLGDLIAEVLARDRVLALLLAHGNTTEEIGVVVPALAITLGVDVARISDEIVGHLGGDELTEGGIVGHSVRQSKSDSKMG